MKAITWKCFVALNLIGGDGGGGRRTLLMKPSCRNEEMKPLFNRIIVSLAGLCCFAALNY